MARQRENASFQDAKRWIRKNFPSEYTVRIQLVAPSSINGDDGRVRWIPGKNEDHFRILIADNLNIHQTIDTLFHEWAHVLTTHSIPLDENSSHPDVFWAHYGRIYRKWHGEP